MIKVISKKRWDNLEQQFVELQLDLGQAIDDNQTYKKQVDLLLKQNKELEERIKGLIEEVDRLNSKKKSVKVKVKSEDVKTTRTKKVKEVENEKEGNNTQR